MTMAYLGCVMLTVGLLVAYLTRAAMPKFQWRPNYTVINGMACGAAIGGLAWICIGLVVASIKGDLP